MKQDTEIQKVLHSLKILIRKQGLTAKDFIASFPEDERDRIENLLYRPANQTSKKIVDVIKVLVALEMLPKDFL